MKPIRVGFRLTPTLRLWAGGRNYLRNLLQVLGTYKKDTIRPVLFGGQDLQPEDVRGFHELVADPIVKIAAFSSQGNTARTIQTIFWGSDSAAEHALAELGIDVLFEQGAFYGWRPKTPTVVWIADFQHCYLPEMFGRLGALKRDLTCRLKSAGHRTVMVSSWSARDDGMRFYKIPSERLVVVPFTVLSHENAIFSDVREVLAKYDIPEKFFFLPNQFWKHKNHQVVADALSILNDHGKEVVVVASGSVTDPRNPSLYEDFCRSLAERGLTHLFRHIGSVPYEHLVALFRSATAIINPSLFEGWSTTVEEAKSYGTPLIVSSLPVHREQLAATDVETAFFDPRAPEELANILFEKWHEWPIGPRPAAEQQARIAMTNRAMKFADDFEAAIRHALARA